jgi:hypothetical protein
MCTLTVIPNSGRGWRLAFNRDEARSRCAALPPHRHQCEGRIALFPVDPVSRGTWLAINDAGLVLALLNVNPPALPPRRGRRSRGNMIPGLLPCGSLEEVQDRFDAFSLAEFPPFRLVAMHEGVVSERHFDGANLFQSESEPIVEPRMYTSSGLGDHLVEAPRRILFKQMITDGSDWLHQQDRFHQHSWPESPHLSVCMRRSNARTVSCTTMEWDETGAWMIYHPDAPDLAARPALARLQFSRVETS